ncbi:MAG: hypothetical protein RLZZ398_239 [Verrucomicrobiota bacterium]|jgi:hypothetical protein
MRDLDAFCGFKPISLSVRDLNYQEQKGLEWKPANRIPNSLWGGSRSGSPAREGIGIVT